MSKQNKRFSTLPAMSNERRSKVLLVGNGINLSFPSPLDTDTLIKNEWKKHYGTILPGRKDNNLAIWKLPFPLQVVAATGDHVQTCMSELAEQFRNAEIGVEQKDFIHYILNVGFDAILTTNYSLEFERAVFDSFSPNQVYRCYRTTQEQTSQQKNLGIYQCIELPDKQHTLLWHIHGSALRKASLVMGQLYYGKLLSEVTARAHQVKNKHKKAFDSGKTYVPESWIDYFLIGDVHIFGFRMDFSESDIWWLLSFKKACFPETRVYFYDQKIDEAKELMLRCYDVLTPKIDFKHEEDKPYIAYYKRIIDQLK